MRVLTVSETAVVLGIAPYTLNVLVENDAVSCGYYPVDERGGQVLGFLEKDVLRLAAQKGNYVMTDRESYIAALKARIEETYPDGLAVLRAFDRQFAPPSRKYFSLIKEPHKALGFVYYVRYYDPEKKELIGSKWSTYTNNREKAEAFAEANRDRLIAGYQRKKQKKINLFGILEDYYKEGSEYLKTAGMRGNTISDHQRRTSYNFIVKTFIPYLKENKIQSCHEIEPALINRLQDKLLLRGIKPQTVNYYARSVKAVFEYLQRNGIIEENVFDRVKNLKVSAQDKKTHGCYELEKPRGVFNREWEDERSYLLNLMIYTTNMRDIEIERLTLNDIVRIEDCYFITIAKSKTRNGERMVPLHSFVYGKLADYAKRHSKGPEDRLFLFGKRKNQSGVYKKAYMDLAAMLGVDGERLKKENITYYSGRHFWKTLMSAENLGDAEECFMGHKVSGDVKKLYDHKDKRGRERMLRKARAVFEVLDRCLLTIAESGPPGGPGPGLRQD